VSKLFKRYGSTVDSAQGSPSLQNIQVSANGLNGNI
jgi:hypothetical protein